MSVKPGVLIDDPQGQWLAVLTQGARDSFPQGSHRADESGEANVA